MSSPEIKGLPGDLLNGITPGPNTYNNIAFQTPGNNLACADTSRKARLTTYLGLRESGYGLHTSILGGANRLRNAGISPNDAFQIIRACTLDSGRDVPDSELSDAIEKAYSEDSSPVKSIKSVRKILSSRIKERLAEKGALIFNKIVKENTGITLEDLLALSPVTIPDDPRQHAALLIKALYDRWEIIAVGERFDVQHGSCESILKELEEATPERLAELLQANPLIIPNPLTGQKALTKSGKPSFRCDEAIAKRRFAIAEMDRATLCEQAGFWHYMVRSEFPVAAIIHSGGKSLHAWIKVDCANAEEWDTMVKRRLFQRILIPLGCDAACSNPSRLSRLSGHYREEKQAYQRLLYLNGGV